MRASLFPRLLVVPVQPAFAAACIIAMPPWEAPGIPVVIACYVPPLRVFAQSVPAVLGAEDIVRIAQVDEQCPVRVYVADTPWPVGSRDRFHVDVGELITIVPDGHPFIPPVRLSAMLASFEGWQRDPVLPCPPADALWVVTEQAPIRFVAPPPPREPVRGEVAHLLRIPEADLHFIPADPVVRDQARGGLPTRQVFIAAPAAPDLGTPFVLDMRPVLLYVAWDRAPQGRVDVARLCERHKPSCPPGHFIRVHGGFADGDIGNHYRFVHPGQVITVEFCLRRASAVVASEVSGDASASHSVGGGGADTDSSRTESADVPAGSASSSTGFDAGTGGTRRTVLPEHPPSWGDSTSIGLRAAMWDVGIVRAAMQVGSWRPTSVALADIDASEGATAFLGCLIWKLQQVACRFAFGTALAACRALWSLAGGRHAVCVLFLLAFLPSCAVGVQVFDIAADESVWPCDGVKAPEGALVSPDEVIHLQLHATRHRPLPTPCRQGRRVANPCPPLAPDGLALPCSPTGDGRFKDAAPLRTLLEESRDADPLRTFFEARAVVETLFEHFNVASPAGKLEQCRMHLPLAALLEEGSRSAEPAVPKEPVQWFHLEDGVCDTPLTTALFADLLRFCPLCSTGLLPPDLDKPERFQQWVSEGSPQFVPAAATALCLTSDGSFPADSGGAGWGVVISACTPDRSAFPGVFVGAVWGVTADVWSHGGDVAGPVPVCGVEREHPRSFGYRRGLPIQKACGRVSPQGPPTWQALPVTGDCGCAP